LAYEPRLDLITQLVGNDAIPLVRTDFSNDAAWERVAQAVTAPADFGTGIDPEVPGDDGLYVPNVAVVDDRDFEGATGRSPADSATGEQLGYVLLADDRSMREAAEGSSPSSTST
jgi:hypothetical protein